MPRFFGVLFNVPGILPRVPLGEMNVTSSLPSVCDSGCFWVPVLGNVSSATGV